MTAVLTTTFLQYEMCKYSLNELEEEGTLQRGSNGGRRMANTSCLDGVSRANVCRVSQPLHLYTVNTCSSHICMPLLS